MSQNLQDVAGMMPVERFSPSRSQLEFTLNAIREAGEKEAKSMRPLRRLILNRRLAGLAVDDEEVIAAAEELHNRGMLPPEGTLHFLSPEQWERVMEIVKLFLPLLLKLFGL